MINIENIKSVYFIGIGGIGMSAIARFFLQAGCSVSGYDKVFTSLSGKLKEEGAYIHYDENIDKIPEGLDLVIYTPAIPIQSPLIQEISKRNIPIVKRAEVLGSIVASYKLIAIAGSHGKTTVTAMISHVFKHANLPSLAFIGGVSVNYQTNFLSDENAEWAIVEADEFDRSFLQLHPDIAVITSIDPDHLDVYGGSEEMEKTFNEFSAQIKPGGRLIAEKSVIHKLNSDTITSYSSLENGDYSARNINIEKSELQADIYENGTLLTKVIIGSPALYNVTNVLAAFAVCRAAGIQTNIIAEAIASFSGVNRRFEIVLNKHKIVLIDDYAHHPEEIKACVKSAKALFPNKTLTVIFQPHLFSRTRDLKEDFIQSLSLADELYLLDIYPARELPIPGITSNILLEQITCGFKKMSSLETIANDLSIRAKGQIVIVMGAGDIDITVRGIKEKIDNFLKNKTCG